MKTKTTSARVTRGLATGARPRVIISTDQVDDQGDRITQAGLSFRERLRVMFAHQYNSLPVGLVTTLDRYPHRTEAEWTWFEDDANAARVRNIYEQGGLDASIGFKYQEAAATPNEHGGFDIAKARVVELSLTPVPANEGAVALAKALGRPGADDVDLTMLTAADVTAALREGIGALARDSVASAKSRWPRGGDEIDIEAIPFRDEDVLAGWRPADVLSAMREGIGSMVSQQVGVAIRRARGRVD